MTEQIKVEPFNCPQCAGQLNLYAGEETQTIVCQYCGSLFDFSTENGQKVAKYREKLSGKIKPIIPLGSSGQFRGEKLTAIGFIVRKITVEGITYRWSEYLLISPTGEYRWLTEYEGHWTYARTVTDIPKHVGNGSTGAREYLHRGVTFQHFQTSSATIDHVLGEFYWQVRAGQQARVEDYISPPFILSSETTKNEVSWSLGIYIAPNEVWQSFKLSTPIKSQTGIFANQPNPYKPYLGKGRKLGAAFIAAAIVIYGFLSSIARNERVNLEHFTFSTADSEKSRVTNPFQLKGHTSNILIRLSTSLDNSWAFFGMSLINSNTGEATDFGKEVSYYHGYDSDGSWQEGHPSGHLYVPSIPPGHYYLRIEPETNATTLNYSVEVKRDVPRFWYLILLLLFLAVPLIWTEMCSYNFEVRRWAESDHPMSSSEEDD